jgi:hypothetical protein
MPRSAAKQQREHDASYYEQNKRNEDRVHLTSAVKYACERCSQSGYFPRFC